MNTNRTYELRDTLVSLKDVCLSYDGRPVLNRITAEVKDIVRPNCVTGQIVGILGPSGIGKTQLSLVMAGLQPPTSGEVIVAKKAPPGEEVVRDGIVGYVPQDYPLFAHRRVFGNLTKAARQRGLDAKQAEEEAMRYLNMFDLADKKFAFPAQLSGGQRQRISIAQQLLCSEHYLIMDEPTTGLDPVMKDKVCDLIKQVACIAEENTIFLISHDIESVLTLADTLWIMGRTFDEKKQSLGASIKYIYNLIERGIAWSDNPKAVPGFSDLQREIRAKFDEL